MICQSVTPQGVASTDGYDRMEDAREEIHRSGHRAFVGGNDQYWDQIGALQFEFLVRHGLSPADTLVDVACGSLRGGCRFIEYLEPGHYLGIDKYIELIIYGVASELGVDEFATKRPCFVVSDTFEFEKFDKKPTFAIAQSLFTHLADADLKLCLAKLRNIAAPKCKFFATFFEVDRPTANPAATNSHLRFAYTRSQLEEFGIACGWVPRYIGEWNHPRNQKMMTFCME